MCIFMHIVNVKWRSMGPSPCPIAMIPSHQFMHKYSWWGCAKITSGMKLKQIVINQQLAG